MNDGSAERMTTHRRLPPHLIPRALIGALIAGIAVLIPWTIYLAYALPRRDLVGRYDVMWVGFDVLLIIFMIAVAVLAIRRSRAIEIPAAILSVLLVVDMWFDFMTDDSRRALFGSALSAVLIEVPTAVVLAGIVWRVERHGQAGLTFERRLSQPQPSSLPTTETNDTISPG